VVVLFPPVFVPGVLGFTSEVWAEVAPILTREEPQAGQVPRVAGWPLAVNTGSGFWIACFWRHLRQ